VSANLCRGAILNFGGSNNVILKKQVKIFSTVVLTLKIKVFTFRDIKKSVTNERTNQPTNQPTNTPDHNTSYSGCNNAIQEAKISRQKRATVCTIWKRQPYAQKAANSCPGCHSVSSGIDRQTNGRTALP